MNRLKLDVDLARELQKAFCRTGWTNSEIGDLCKGATLKEIRKVLRDISVITPRLFRINTRNIPRVVKDCEWRVAEHKRSSKCCTSIERRGSHLYLDGRKVIFYVPGTQKKEGCTGYELRKDLNTKVSLNANVLDFLLKNKDLIPQEWMFKRGSGRYFFFWGTIYNDEVGDPGVRFLTYHENQWVSDFRSLRHYFRFTDPALILRG